MDGLYSNGVCRFLLCSCSRWCRVVCVWLVGSGVSMCGFSFLLLVLWNWISGNVLFVVLVSS